MNNIKEIWNTLKELGFVCWFVGCDMQLYCNDEDSGYKCSRCDYCASAVINEGGIFRWLWNRIRYNVTFERLHCCTCHKLTFKKVNEHGQRFCSEKCENSWMPF